MAVFEDIIGLFSPNEIEMGTPPMSGKPSNPHGSDQESFSNVVTIHTIHYTCVIYISPEFCQPVRHP